jgi:hypothetical protein
LELSAEAAAVTAEAPLGPADAVADATDAAVEVTVEVASSLDMLAAAAAAAAGESSCDTVPMDLTPAATAAALVGLQDLSVPTAAEEADQGFASPAQNPDCAVSVQNPGALAVLSPGRGLSPQKKRVLLVGNPALPLKGFPTAIAALTAVSAVLPIKVRWVCQVSLFVLNPIMCSCMGMNLAGNMQSDDGWARWSARLLAGTPRGMCGNRRSLQGLAAWGRLHQCCREVCQIVCIMTVLTYRSLLCCWHLLCIHTGAAHRCHDTRSAGRRA